MRFSAGSTAVFIRWSSTSVMNGCDIRIPEGVRIRIRLFGHYEIAGGWSGTWRLCVQPARAGPRSRLRQNREPDPGIRARPYGESEVRRVPPAVRYAWDVPVASTGPWVNAVISGMTSNCLIETFRMAVSPLNLATNGPFTYASNDAWLSNR